MTTATNGKPQFSHTKQIEEVRTKLRELGGFYMTEELIERGGVKIRLPEDMTEVEAIKFLKRLYDENQAEADWSRTYRYRPLDGIAAMTRVFKNTFGGVAMAGGLGFWGPTPPSLIDLEVSPGVFEQVPAIGDGIALPHMPEVTFRGYTKDDPEYGELFHLIAAGKKACAGEVQALFAMVEEELQRNSIYRGKAIHDGFGFLTLDLDPTKVVYAEETQVELETNIYARLRYPEALRDLGQPLKGAVLLEGTYGVGKTLAATLTAQEAVRNGWTFVLVRPENVTGRTGSETFRRAMQTAELYEPAVVFVEDIDTLTGSDSETDRISVMLDVFDGARSKGREVLAVLTTNHVEQIHKGIVRPGRFDAIINVPPPDRPGIIKLVKVLVPEELLSSEITDEEWEHVGEAMDGFIPAAVAEACQRAVRYMVWRQEGEVNGSKLDHLDLCRGAASLHRQMGLLEEAKDVPEREALSVAFEHVFEPLVEERVEAVIRETLNADALDGSRSVTIVKPPKVG